MKKNNIRDYAAEAFRFYANYYQGRLKPELDAAEQADIKAVRETIDEIREQPDGQIAIRCLEIVYFARPAKYAARGEITERATRAATDLGLSETGVYRILRILRETFAVKRGLRIDKRGG